MEQQTGTALLERIAEQISKGEYDEARKGLAEAEAHGENRAEVMFLQGRLQEVTYDRTGAAATYAKVLELDPDNTEAMFRLALLRDLHGEDDEAIELYERCTSGTPVHVNALINLAVLCEERGHLREAETYLRSVLSEYPNHERARHFLKSVVASHDMLFDERVARERERYDADLEVPITDFELSVRSRNCLRQMNIRTLGDLLRTTEAELLSYKNFGETSLNEIKAMLTQKGLSLGQALRPEEQVTTSARPAHVEGASAFNKLVSELELSVRARKCVQLLGAVTMGDLLSHSEAELLATKNFGQTSLNEIKRELQRFGLALRE
ncbi:MAG: DNA-directed RNA polymerase subunit alpha C-terminal domain-containing protein [Phycisphaerae bacterium]